MGTNVKFGGGGGQRALPAEGIQKAVCIRVIDLGTQEVEWQGNKKEQHQIRLTFELVETSHVFNEEKGPEPFVVSNTYTMSLSEKSHLYAMIMKWNKNVIQKLKEEQSAELDLKVFLGAPALVNVVHSEDRNGNTWANIGDKGRDVMNRGGQEIPEPKNEKVYFNIDWLEDDPQKASKMIEEDLWAGEKKKVVESLEYQKANDGNDYVESAGDDEDPGF